MNRHVRDLITLAVVTLVLAGSAPSRAEDDWAPPEPSDSAWDWAKLDSGEWIKGELYVMHRDRMVFESDKFDDLDIDWEDVIDLRLARPRVFRLTGERFYTGMGEMRSGVMRVETSEGESVEFSASELVSIAYTGKTELRNWRVRIGANVAGRSGNTDQFDLSAKARVERATSLTRWLSRYTGTFSKVNGSRTANNHRASTEFDILLTDRFFVRVPFFEFFQDEFQNIDGRYTPGLGVGYEPIDNPVTYLQLSLGVATQITRFDSGAQDEDAAVILGATLNFDFPRDIDLDLFYQAQLIATDLDKTSQNASAVLSFEIWDPIDLEIGGYLDRIERPERDSNGDRPKRNDLRLTIGLAIEF